MIRISTLRPPGPVRADSEHTPVPLPRILFPHNPLEPRKPDFDFEDQHRAALEAGFEVGILDTDRGELARLYPDGDVLYRGWMVTADRYAELYNALEGRGLRLLTSPEAYRQCHHLPGWYGLLEGTTPASVWYPEARGWSSQDVRQALGEGPWVVKDYVKSAKHYWHEACYIPDRASLTRVTERFLELRGEDLEGGLVFRRFLPLQRIGTHPQSGMPLTLEYRAFFWQGRLVWSDRYWEAGDYPESEPPWTDFTSTLARVKSPFFTLDAARDTQGRWWIVEFGDGQVSGLPPATDPTVFYSGLAQAIDS